MTRKPIFKTDIAKPVAASDPEDLFRNLHRRAPEIRHLWSQQADLLRAYYKECPNTPDVAIELPTGAGKTLVGLLIAEWRRQSKGERAAYVCPTRQLARQVGAHAGNYGIPTHVLIGTQRAYNPTEFSNYQSSRAIAVTTYSAIFNVNPRIKDAQTLILDDAHAGENFMANMWSLEISRDEDSNLYFDVLGLLKPAFDSGTFADLMGNSELRVKTQDLIELVPGAHLRANANAITNLLNERIPHQTPQWFSWNEIRGHLQASNIFVSWDHILIRPFIPPTRSHTPFSQGNQRIYMSATLGEGGELERITGIDRIVRLPLPTGWDKRGSGRRLFLMPELAFLQQDAVEVVGDAIQKLGRGLVLAPSKHGLVADRILNDLKARGIRKFGAEEIEDSLEPFTNSTNSVLFLYRYDGIDLPDETCRLVVLGGLPSGTNLQERFLWNRISTIALLRDRVLTRITQGVGRCTRSDNDYSVVIVVGTELTNFLQKQDNLHILTPELQAEIIFGIENSREQCEPSKYTELIEAFLKQDDEWKNADAEIVSLRESNTRYSDPVSRQLKVAIVDEVAYQYARWNDDLETALERARKVADALSGDETKTYRAWWYYLSADVAMALFEETGRTEYRDTAMDLLSRASVCSPSIRWFAKLRRSLTDGVEERDSNEITAAAVEAIRRQLIHWGAVGPRFEEELSRIATNLHSTDHKHFHQGLKGLGTVLGFGTELPDSNAAPDCVWYIGRDIYISHEAKTEHSPGGPIGASDVRQAENHWKWVRKVYSCEDNTKVYCLIESPRTTIAEDATVFAGDLYHVTPKRLTEIFDQIASILRRVRSRMTNLSDDKVLEELYTELYQEKLTPERLLERLTSQQARTMRTDANN